MEAVGATAVDPFSGMNLANFTAREDRMPADARDFLPIAWRVVTPGFFRAMGVKVLEGRTFRNDDGVGDGRHARHREPGSGRRRCGPTATPWAARWCGATPRGRA